MALPKNEERIARVLEEISKYTKGVWSAEVARELKIPNASVHNYIQILVERNQIEAIRRIGQGEQFVGILYVKKKPL